MNVVDGQRDHAEHPKSDHGRRTIDLVASTMAILRRQRATQLERRLLVGEGWADGDLVFCGPPASHSRRHCRA